MAKPFISWISRNEPEMKWLREILLSLGFEEPIVLGSSNGPGSPNPVLIEVQRSLERADCLFALVSPSEDNRVRDWMQFELNAAMTLQLPIAAFVAPNVTLTKDMQSAFIWQNVDFTAPEALVQATPAIIQLALKIQRVVDGLIPTAPSFYDEVHNLTRIERGFEEDIRSITLTAGLGFKNEVEHTLDLGADKTPGLSVRLTDPSRDLQFVCRERPNSTCEIEHNRDDEVKFRIRFDPPLHRGDTVRYRTVARYKNTYPLTAKEVLHRAANYATSPYMRDGFLGGYWEVRKPTERLILELEADLDIGLSLPELRVYVVDSEDEILAERERIGNHRVAPRHWEIREDLARNQWSCRVIVPRPAQSCVYALIAKPPG